MNRAITITAFLLLCLLSHAQVPNFFLDGARWLYLSDESSEPGQKTVHSSYEQHIIHGDTIIGELEYLKLYITRHNILTVLGQMPPHPDEYHTYDSLGPFFLRYDTLLSKVYYLPSIDSTERLIYDFTLQVGDTIPMQSDNFELAAIHVIDTVSIFGVPLRRFFVADTGYTATDEFNVILEGLGGSNGLTYFQPFIVTLGGGVYTTLLCCFQYQDSIYSPYYIYTPYFTTGTCPFIDFLSATPHIENDFKLTISPNPTQDYYTISVSEDLLNSTCTIIDAVGRVVQTFTLTDLQTTSQLEMPGLYYWRVEQQGRLVSTGKLVRL